MFTGYVYIIAPGRDGKHRRPLERVKIGFSRAPLRRLKQLQTGSADELVLMAVLPGTPGDEAAIHEQLDEYRESGEWFRVEGLAKHFVEDATHACWFMPSWNAAPDLGPLPARASSLPMFGDNVELAEALGSSMRKDVAERELYAPLAYNTEGIDPAGPVMEYGLRAALMRSNRKPAYVLGCCRQGVRQGAVA